MTARDAQHAELLHQVLAELRALRELIERERRDANALAVRADQAAALVNVCTKEIRRAVASGELQSLRLGRCVLIRTDALRAWLDSLESESAA